MYPKLYLSIDISLCVRSINAIFIGSFLSIQDGDDVMLPRRVERQVERLQEPGQENSIVGCLFARIPINATLR